MSIQQPQQSPYSTQPYVHFPTIKSTDSHPSLHTVDVTKREVVRIVMEKPVFPVKATKIEPSARLPSPVKARKRELLDERGVEEEVARNVSKILSASRLLSSQTQSLPPPASSSPKPSFSCSQCNKNFTCIRNLQRHNLTPCTTLLFDSQPEAAAVREVVALTQEAVKISSQECPPEKAVESPPPSSQDEEANCIAMNGRPWMVAVEKKTCPDCKRILCSSSNLRRHRAICKAAKTDDVVADVQETTVPDANANKWIKCDLPWVTVGEHLKAQHLSLCNVAPRIMIGEPEDIKMEPVEVKETTVPLPPQAASPQSATDSNPFTCSLCYKTFSCRKNVRRHMVALHKVVPPPGAPLNSTPILSLTQVNNIESVAGVTELMEADSTLNDDIDSSSDCLSSDSALSMESTDPLLTFFDWRRCGREGDVAPDSTTHSRPPLSTSRDELWSRKKVRLDGGRDDDRAVLTAHSVKFVVSRCAAIRASPVLASLLTSQREANLDVDPNSLQALLVVHNDPTALSVDNISGVSEMALRLRVTDVRLLCERFIANELPQFSIMRAIRLADQLKLLRVKELLFESLSIQVFRSLSSNVDYREMRPELKAELLEKWGSFL